MPIAAGDIDYRLSGGAGNANPNASLGGVISSTELVDNVDNNLFDDVSGDEHTAGRTEYRCVYVRNSHGTLQLSGAKVWRASHAPGSDTVAAIGVGTAAINGTEQTIADETTAPAGITWSTTAIDRATGLALGDIPAGQHKAVWIRRVVSPGSTPQAAASVGIQAGGDTL
jgi:hypothetical protein